MVARLVEKADEGSLVDVSGDLSAPGLCEILDEVLPKLATVINWG